MASVTTQMRCRLLAAWQPVALAAPVSWRRRRPSRPNRAGLRGIRRRSRHRSATLSPKEWRYRETMSSAWFCRMLAAGMIWGSWRRMARVWAVWAALPRRVVWASRWGCLRGIVLIGSLLLRSMRRIAGTDASSSRKLQIMRWMSRVWKCLV